MSSKATSEITGLTLGEVKYMGFSSHQSAADTDRAPRGTTKTSASIFQL